MTSRRTWPKADLLQQRPARPWLATAAGTSSSAPLPGDQGRHRRFGACAAGTVGAPASSAVAAGRDRSTASCGEACW